MSPELISAIRERIALGRSREEIETEVIATGYTSEQFAQAYETATLPMQTAAAGLAPSNTSYYPRVATGTLISFKDMLSAAFTLAWQEKVLFFKLTGAAALLSIVLGLIIIFTSDLFPLSDDLAAVLIGGGAFLATLIIFTTVPMILIRAILKRRDGQSLRVHTEWTLRHLLEIGLCALFSITLILTGFMLFIIPGIIMSMYLSLTLFYYLDGKGTVMDAMVQATASVYGRFWAVFGRVFVLGFVVGAISQIAMILSMATFILAPLVLVLVILASYFVQYCGIVALYESVITIPAAKPLPITESTLRTIYKVVGVIGSVIFVGICVALVAYFSDYGGLNSLLS